MELTRVRVSAKRVTSQEAPIAWSVGIEKEFLAKHPDHPPRMRMTAENGKIYVFFSEEGLLLGNIPNISWSWTTFSRIWLGNFKQPRDRMVSTEMDALYDPETFRFELDPAGYTVVMRAALSDTSDQTSIIGLEAMDTFKVYPRSTKVAIRKAPAKEQPRLPLPESVIPDHLNNWTDQNVKNLKALITDLQRQRRDIVIHVVNGSVLIHKTIYEEL